MRKVEYAMIGSGVPKVGANSTSLKDSTEYVIIGIRLEELFENNSKHVSDIPWV